MNAEDLLNRHAHHENSSPEVGHRHTGVRIATHAAAKHLAELCPPSRELSLAMTKLEEARMWANAAIACNQSELPADVPAEDEVLDDPLDEEVTEE